MPTYEYSCPECGTFEFVQKMSDDALKLCPTCSAPVQRLIAATAFHLKGSGWYKTDYAKSGTASQASNTSSSEQNTDGGTNTSSSEPSNGKSGESESGKKNAVSGSGSSAKTEAKSESSSSSATKSSTS